MGNLSALLWKTVRFCIFIEILFSQNLCKVVASNGNGDENGVFLQREEWVLTSEEGNDLWNDTNIVDLEFESEIDTNTDLKSDRFFGFSDIIKATVNFYLYNRNRNGSDVIRYLFPGIVMNSHFVPGLPVKFLIHGYRMNAFSHFSHHIIEAYQQYGEEFNVFSVDWKRLAADYIYFNSAFNTRIVGEAVGEFIVYLRNHRLIDSYEMVHIIGFSLGAHVAGYAGKYVKRTQNETVGRISGLDPAGPAFTGPHSKNRLDKEDADFVDVIHTSVGKSGISWSLGHVDFYPNGGIHQPGCLWESVTSALLGNCSHERAFYLFLQSIKGEKFLGCPCKDWVEYQRAACHCTLETSGATLLGEHCPNTARGDKFLNTRAVLLQLIS